eukprot:1803727-Alexandrium_andersonii.AAC.1
MAASTLPTTATMKGAMTATIVARSTIATTAIATTQMATPQWRQQRRRARGKAGSSSHNCNSNHT